MSESLPVSRTSDTWAEKGRKIPQEVGKWHQKGCEEMDRCDLVEFKADLREFIFCKFFKRTYR